MGCIAASSVFGPRRAGTALRRGSDHTAFAGSRGRTAVEAPGRQGEALGQQQLVHYHGSITFANAMKWLPTPNCGSRPPRRNARSALRLSPRRIQESSAVSDLVIPGRNIVAKVRDCHHGASCTPLKLHLVPPDCAFPRAVGEVR